MAIQIPETQIRESDYLVTLVTGGSIQVRSADHPDSLRGEGLDLVVIDEAAYVPEAAWTEVLRPALADRVGGAFIISTPAGRNWFWKAWCRGQEGERDWESWRFPTSSNPHIAAEEVEAARSMLPERTFRQEFLAEWLGNEGVFFPEWDEGLHTCEPVAIPKDWTRWAAVDYGFAEPFAVLWAARSPGRERVYVYREYYRRNLRDEQQAALIKALSGQESVTRVYGDPSMWNERREQNKRSIARVYGQCGVPLVKAMNNRKSGWQAVRNALAGETPRLRVFRSCRNLIRTLPEMVHDAVSPEDLADKVDGRKTEDHMADCLRYLLAAEATKGRQVYQGAMSFG